MVEIAARLRTHSIIGLDTSIFIYYIDDYPEFSNAAEKVLSHVVSGMSQGVTSVLTLMEISVLPIRQGAESIAQEYLDIVTNLNGRRVAPIHDTTAVLAAGLRARHNVRPADALQVAACLEHSATAFVTNDRRLQRVSELEVIMLGS